MTTTAIEEDQSQTVSEGQYPAYPEYKDSGVKWLGEIPEHWAVNKLKFLLKKNQSGTWGDKPTNGGKIVLRSTEQSEDGSWQIQDPAIRKLTEEEFKETKLEAGDLVITTSSGSKDHIGKTSLVTKKIEEKDCSFSNFMQRIRPTNSLDSKFLLYLFNSDICREQFKYYQNSTTGLGNINGELIGQLRIPLVPVDEQKAIVEFLDRETGKIDRLIERKEELIDLLREKRTALITETVTQGLDPDVEMKDSGVEWLGEIPEDWEVSTLGHVTHQLTNGYVGSTNDILQDDGVPYIQSTHIENGEIKFNGEYYVTEKWNQEHKNSILSAGDVLIVQSGDVGECAVVEKNLEGANCHALIIAKTVEEVEGKYLNNFLRTKLGKDLLKLTQTGATIKHLNTTRVKDVSVLIPPKQEQLNIVSYIEDQTTKIDQSIEKIEEAIVKLKEYRTALITAAVTGKIDVRGEV